MTQKEKVGDPMVILSPRIFPNMVEEDAAYFHHHQQQQQQLSPSTSFDDESNLFHPRFSSKPYSNSSPSYPMPRISTETTPGFSVRSVKTLEAFTKRPQKNRKTESWNSPHTVDHEMIPCSMVISPSLSLSRPPESHLISFGNPDCSPAISNPFYGAYEIQDCEGPRMKSAGMVSRKLVHSQEHVQAERKRREKINELFITLSAIIPNLKKINKASILEDAVRYLKELQHRIKVLEEELAAKTMKSAIVVKKSQLTVNDNTCSLSNKNSCGQIDQQLSLPEIEAQISGRCILIKIHCERRKDFISIIIKQIENLNLTVVSSCVLPFGSAIIDVTILAQMDVEISLKMGDLVRNLRQALLDLM